MRYVLRIMLLMSLLYSCSETECCADVETIIIGEWKLSKLCTSIGNSSCSEDKLEDATYDDTYSFLSDGSFTNNREGSECIGTYSLDDDREVTLTSDDRNCTFFNTTLRITKLTNTEMFLSLLCVDGCLYLYLKQ